MRKLKDLMEAWPISQVKKFQRVVEISLKVLHVVLHS